MPPKEDPFRENLCERLDLAPEKLEPFLEEFEPEFKSLARTFGRIETARGQIQARFPSVNVVPLDSYVVVQSKWGEASPLVQSQTPRLSELWLTVTDLSATERRVYCLQWTLISSPRLGIYPRLDILQHREPHNYRALNEGIPEFWDLIPPSCEYAQTLIGVALMKSSKELVRSSAQNVPALIDLVPAQE